MKPTIMTAVVAVGAVVIVVAILGLARFTQSDSDRAMTEADLHTAKAIRLLASYEANLDQIAILRDQIGRQLGGEASPVAVPPKGSDVEELVRGALEDFQAFSKELRDRARKGPSDALDQRLRQLVPDASEVSEMPKLDLGQNESAISKGLAKAVKELDTKTKENARILKEALQEADSALRVRYGEAGMDDHVNANSVKACVLYLQGEVKRCDAMAARLEVQQMRLRALRLIDQSSGLSDQIKDTQGRLPTHLTKRLSDEKADLDKRLAEAKKHLAELDAQVAGVEKQIAAAKKEAESAGEAIKALEAKKYDPKSPADVKRYVEEYGKLSDRRREADLRAVALERGTLQGAKLDDAHGRDPMKDRYVPESGDKKITVVKGLTTLTQAKASAAKAVADIEALIKSNDAQSQQAKSLVERLDKHIAELTKLKGDVDKKIMAIVSQDEGAAGGIKARLDTAMKAEDEAIALYGKARQAYKKASRAARGRGGEVATELGMTDKEGETAMTIGQADVEHADALVNLQRVRGFREQIALAQAALAAKVSGVDQGQVDALKEGLASSWEASLKAIDASIELLNGAANKMKKQNYGWISQASLAAALQLKSLLASGPDAATALDEAIAQYEAAVQGREGSPFLKPYVRVLARAKAIQETGLIGGPRPATRPAATQAEGSEAASKASEKPAAPEKAKAPAKAAPAPKPTGPAKAAPKSPAKTKAPAKASPAPKSAGPTKAPPSKGKRPAAPAQPQRTPAKAR
ncbi:MAG: hypothetical protein JXQ73_12415 [Phycisphaerae bacterium]|nr:hypothetical protein [Phycisphaerae bacterium]